MKGAFTKISLFFILLIQAYFSYASKNICVIYPSNLPEYKIAAIEIEKKIRVLINLTGEEAHNIDIISERQLKTISTTKTDLFISLGTQNLNKTNKLINNSPVIYSFVTQENLPIREMENKKSWSTIYINQPTKNLIEIAEKTVQNKYKNEILITLSEENKEAIKEIRNYKKIKNVKIKIIPIKESDNPAKLIEKHLFNAAAIIAIPDKIAWSNKNARWILHQAYTYKVPVIGYSEAFLRAGAMISVYSSAENIAKKTSEEVSYWLKTGQLKNKAITPKRTIKTNPNIARALGYSIDFIDNLEREP